MVSSTEARAALAVALISWLSWPAGAAADGSPGTGEAFSIGAQPAWFLMAGISGGGTFATGSRGLYVGGELSIARIKGRGFVGFYVDGYYDFSVDGTYVTVGPELGLIRRSETLPLAIGLDGGAAFRFAGDSDAGGTARVFVAIAGPLSIYGRYLHFGSGEDDRVVQVGIALKFPLTSPFGAGAR